MRVSTAFSILAATAAAAVVIIPGGDPKPYRGDAAVTSEDAFFRRSAPNEFFNSSAKLIMSSHSAVLTKGRGTNLTSADGLQPSGDSFLRGAIQAWGEHLHLVLRPDEVWFTILVQLNFYMAAHAEEVRSLFVSAPPGTQQEIYIEDVTLYRVLIRFQDEIQKRIKTPWLRDWIAPGFSTTTQSDAMTANILMMGLTKAYFKYTGKVVCGLPSVTLLGTAADWDALLAKLDRLPAFGAEPAQYAARLRPVLSRFAQSFRSPDAESTRRFWNQMVIGRRGQICGDPPVWMSGWITGFWSWNERGGAYARVSNTSSARGSLLTLDGVAYPTLDVMDAPIGYARTPLLLLDWDGVAEFPAFVAAGPIGKQITEDPPAGYREAVLRAGGNGSLVGGGDEKKGHASLRPLSGWMVYGPLEHNKTNSAWVVEDELAIVQASAARYFSEVCGASRVF
ncbi:hypothetical protein B0T24DRAFT_525801 [Lasiosphaeria ovina]|uniref:Uncharacterized protein n=1 Tax=Lasiosphaeria ovina TaxID=92902 RepID=A0AAE0KI30_9PEZI|nr:hypothetical protein B0T24DRAFT_525801 [Lasiosphaeria ovina]